MIKNASDIYKEILATFDIDRKVSAEEVTRRVARENGIDTGFYPIDEKLGYILSAKGKSWILIKYDNRQTPDDIQLLMNNRIQIGPDLIPGDIDVLVFSTAINDINFFVNMAKVGEITPIPEEIYGGKALRIIQDKSIQYDIIQITNTKSIAANIWGVVKNIECEKIWLSYDIFDEYGKKATTKDKILKQYNKYMNVALKSKST